MDNTQKEMSWSFFQLWNESLEQREERKLVAREKIWASELGGSMIDRYLKMKGIAPSNPPNPRSLRKFEAGNIWEHIVEYVLKRAGLLIDQQNWIQYQYPNLLPVSGKLDFLAGGHPDFQTAQNVINTEFSWLPETVKRGTIKIIHGLQETFGMAELKTIVIEVKSCSSFMFDVYERSGSANPNHRLQLYHYLKCKGLDEGHIVYVCKDDCRMLEIGVFQPSHVEEEYRSDIERISYYVKNDERPPLERPIVFDKDFGKFSANWKVAYSGYLTLLYGINNQMEFDEVYKPMAEKWNRVLKRIIEGKEMTKNNDEHIVNIKKAFPNFDEIIISAKAHQKVLDERKPAEDIKEEVESETTVAS